VQETLLHTGTTTGTPIIDGTQGSVQHRKNVGKKMGIIPPPRLYQMSKTFK
jgi:hypothetical protein